MPSPPLTERQSATLLAIDDLIRKHDGIRPSLPEIGGSLDGEGWYPATVKRHVDQLKALGLVTYRPGETRTLSITPAGKREVRILRRAVAELEAVAP